MIVKAKMSKSRKRTMSKKQNLAGKQIYLNQNLLLFQTVIVLFNRCISIHPHLFVYRLLHLCFSPLDLSCFQVTKVGLMINGDAYQVISQLTFFYFKNVNKQSSYKLTVLTTWRKKAVYSSLRRSSTIRKAINNCK